MSSCLLQEFCHGNNPESRPRYDNALSVGYAFRCLLFATLLEVEFKQIRIKRYKAAGEVQGSWRGTRQLETKKKSLRVHDCILISPSKS